MQSIPIAIFGFSLFLAAFIPWPADLATGFPHARYILLVIGIVVQMMGVWCGVTERREWERWIGKRK